MNSRASALALRQSEQPVARARKLLSYLPKGLLLPLLVLGALELSVGLGWIPAHLTPAPSDLLLTFGELAEGPLWVHILASLQRVLIGFSVGAGLALLLGSLIATSPRLEGYVDPTFQALRAVPGLAWVPLLLIWLGIDELSKVTLIAIGSFFPVYMNVLTGIHNVDRKLVEVGRQLGFSTARQIHRIMVPAAQPYLFTGLRNGLSMAWLCVVAAELLAATKGIGYLLTDGREVSRPDLVLVAIITLALMGKLTDSLLKHLEHHLLSRRDSLDREQNA